MAHALGPLQEWRAGKAVKVVLQRGAHISEVTPPRCSGRLWQSWNPAPTPRLPNQLWVHCHPFQETMTQIIFINISHPHPSSIFFPQPPEPKIEQNSFKFRQFPCLLRNLQLVKGARTVMMAKGRVGGMRTFKGDGFLLVLREPAENQN